MPGVGNHGLGIEDVAADELGDSHAQVRVETNAGDAHTRVVLVLGGEIDIVVMVVVVVTTSAAGLGVGSHDS